MSMPFYGYILIIIIYALCRKLLLKDRVRNKTKSLMRLFLFNLIDIGVYLFCGYKLLSKIDGFKPITDSILSNSALLIAVLGFSLQNALKHIIAGAIVSYSGAIKIGDRITLRERNLTGYVEDVTLRHAIIRTYTNQRVVIPNSVLNEEVIINNDLTESTTSYPIIVKLPITADVDKAIQIMTDVIKKNTELLNGEVEVLCSDITQTEVTLKSFIWSKNIDESFKIASDTRLEILRELNKNHINI